MYTVTQSMKIYPPHAILCQKTPFSFKVDAEKLIPFLASITGVPETNIMLAMELRKDIISNTKMIDMNDPAEIEKEIPKFGSAKRVKTAIKTLQNMGLLIERIDPETGRHALVRNLSSQDTIRLLSKLSKNMTDALKTYIVHPSKWPDFPLINDSYASKKEVAERLRQRKANKRSKTV